MKKAIAAAAALLLSAVSMALPSSPASAAGTTYTFSALAQSQHVAFDPAQDVLNFDSAAISAASVRLVDVVGNLGVSAAGKTIYLDGASKDELSYASFTFADGSALLVGDGSVGTRLDRYGADVFGTMGADQLDLLGGRDFVDSGAGNDRLVGNGPLAPLEHLSRSGATGAPTATANPSVSADGNLVAFQGGWTTFGSTNNNGTDVFVKRVDSGSVSDEHRSAGGVNGASGSGGAQLASDGTFVVFESSSGLVGGSPPSNTIYRADTGGSAIVAVSTTTGGGAFADGASHAPDISADGRYVVFTSAATNLASSSGTTQDVFTKDLQTGETLRVSTSTTGGDASADCATPRISADGQDIVFSSAATNLTATSTGGGNSDIYRWHRGGLLTNLTAGTPGGANTSLNPDVAADGSYGGFVTFETNKALVAADTNGQTDVYATSINGGNPFFTGFYRVSATKAGAQVGLASGEPAISDDGLFVAFRSFSDALVPGDTDGYPDVFVKDLTTGDIALVSAPATGVANQGSGAPEISAGGEWVAFESSASNLATTDGNGQLTDVFRVSNPILRDKLTGGPGDDTYVQQRNDDLVEAAAGGTDTVETSGTYVLTAPNVENIVAPPGLVTIDDFTGNSSNNRIDPGLGNDIQRGSAGDDTYVTDSAADVLTGEASASGTDTVESSVTWTLQAALENLTLLPGATNGGGNSGNNVITGNSAANTLTGYAGNDTLIEAGGNDTLNGSSGNDTYVFTHASGAITGESGSTLGTDTVKSSVTWTLQAYLENLTLTGSAAINGSGNTANNVITGNSGANVLSGAAGADTYTGGGGADQFSIDTSATVDTVNDFTVGTDKFRMKQSAWHIGDGDLLVEGATNKTGPGGFSKSSEYVVISKNLTSITTANAAAAIGSATSSYAAGDRRIFVVDNGTSSELFLFISSGADAKVTAAEIKPLMLFKNRNAMSVSSAVFTA